MMKKTPNLKSKIFNHKSAYTLIEVLIAAGIFASAMAIVFTTFSVNSDIRSQTQAMREASISARYSMEAISREFRLASSYTIASSGKSISLDSYDENAEKITRTYSLSQCHEQSETTAICLSVDGTALQPLTSDKINVLALSEEETVFEDRNSGSSQTSQPFLEIKFKITAQMGKKITDQFSQTLATTVAGRSYSNFNSTIPTEQQD